MITITSGPLWDIYVKKLEAVNDEHVTVDEHQQRERDLRLWQEGVSHAYLQFRNQSAHFNGDYHYMNKPMDSMGQVTRPMCCGVFLDWECKLPKDTITALGVVDEVNTREGIAQLKLNRARAQIERMEEKIISLEHRLYEQYDKIKLNDICDTVESSCGEFNCRLTFYPTPFSISVPRAELINMDPQWRDDIVNRIVKRMSDAIRDFVGNAFATARVIAKTGVDQ